MGRWKQDRMRHFISLSLGALSFSVPAITAAPVSAQEDAAAIIASRLADWTDAFNARRVSGTCDLFSADLISTMRGRPDEGRDTVCRRIAKALANPRLRIRYTAQIKEIIVSGDLAVVRLEWLTQTRVGAVRRISHEPGIDIFRRESDGNWRIFRFLAFSDGR